MKRTIFASLFLLTGYALAAQPIQSWSLPNGARVLFVETHAIPVVDISVSFDAGSRRDPQGKSGLAAMTREMMERGVDASGAEPAMNEAELSDAVADIAAQVGGNASADLAQFTLRTLSEKSSRDRAIKLTARILAQPSFPDGVLTREKIRAMASIKEDDTKPASIAHKLFATAIYGIHPYGVRPTATSVDAIARENLIAFHRRHFVSDGAVIAIVGDASRAEADAFAQELTRHLPRSTVPLSAMPEVAISQASEKRLPHPASQAHILIGMPALRRGDSDYFALRVGNYILGGGGFVSRLMNEVREKRGLSYSVSSNFDAMKQEGAFRISLQTKKAQADDALKVTRSTLSDFLRDGPTAEEMKAAKDNLIGGFALYIDTNRKMLGNVATIGYYGLPLDYLDTWKQQVDSVTAEQVRVAFRRKLSPEKMATVIVGSPE